MAAASHVKTGSDTIGTGVRYLAMAALAVIFIFPTVFMVVSSFKPDEQLLRDTSSIRAVLPVGDLSFDNYVGVFERVPAGRFIFNSLFITATIVIFGLVINSMAGFALSRLRWPGQRMVMVLIIATLIVPFETIAIPLLLIVSRLPWIGFEGLRPVIEQGWLNSYHVQIIPFLANSLSIFLFVQYFKSLPAELDEAARVDGASWFQIYRRIILPLSGPAIATVAILTFLQPNVWNAYLWPLLVVQEESIRPVMLGVAYFQQLDVAWGEIMAYLSIITVPVLVFFLSLQRVFIESIASTGVKG
jgi:multiple sugar transport system permease protein